jgi:molybdopterin biosynthesis enzyme
MGAMNTALKPVLDVLQPILQRLAPVVPHSVPIESVRGLALAEPVCTVAPIPLRAVALRSGLAVTSLDLVGASAQSPIILTRAPPPVAAGDELPDGCDAVVDPATVTQAGSILLVAGEATPGMNARLSGQDLRSDALVMPAGSRFTLEAILACRLAGIGTAIVRQPTLSIQIEDQSHESWLRHRLMALGCNVVEHGNPADLLIRSTRQAEPRLALQPGDTSWIEAFPDGSVHIETPRRFDGLIAAYQALVVPVVAELSAQRICAIKRPLARKVASAIGMTELVLLRSSEGKLNPMAITDVTLVALAQSDAYYLVPAWIEGHAVGEIIHAVLLEDPFGLSHHERSP